MKFLKPAGEPSRQLFYEVVSGGSGLALALFMFGHIILVGSILTGARGFDWVAIVLEEYHIAGPTVLMISALFLVHALFASRKIPAKLAERRKLLKLARDLKASSGFAPHADSLLWIWQVRTGIAILILGSFHLMLIGMDTFTPMFGDRVGLEAETTLAREQAGLWLPYAFLTLCIAFHTAVGLYRLAVKWGVGARLSRDTLRWVERLILWGMLGLGTLTLIVMSGLMPPPLAWLIGGTP
jgi:fumarate reductase subunit C